MDADMLTERHLAFFAYIETSVDQALVEAGRRLRADLDSQQAEIEKLREREAERVKLRAGLR